MKKAHLISVSAIRGIDGVSTDRDAAYDAAHRVGNLEEAPSRRRLMVRLMTEEILAASGIQMLKILY